MVKLPVETDLRYLKSIEELTYKSMANWCIEFDKTLWLVQLDNLVPEFSKVLRLSKTKQKLQQETSLNTILRQL